MIKMSPFWNMLAERGISIYDLEYKYHFNPAEISRLKHNHNFTLRTIDRYCTIFQCNIDDIITYVDVGKEEEF